MRDYLEGYHFTVLTDHLALKWLEKIDNTSGRLARWAMELSQWDFEIKYRKGADNMVADAISRQPVETCVIEKHADKDLYQRRLRAVKDDPVGNPEYCLRNDRLYIEESCIPWTPTNMVARKNGKSACPIGNNNGSWWRSTTVPRSDI